MEQTAIAQSHQEVSSFLRDSSNFLGVGETDKQITAYIRPSDVLDHIRIATNRGERFLYSTTDNDMIAVERIRMDGE
jgi:hypothetical protein